MQSRVIITGLEELLVCTTLSHQNVTSNLGIRPLLHDHFLDQDQGKTDQL